jgi:5-methyltetrahydropteroyltriglutamate--homocysteine methyltransferase
VLEPIHSDVIGSLLRPRYLTQARDGYAAGQLTAPEFKRIEDRAVDEAIELQEGIGLDVITDGEYRRSSLLDPITGTLAVEEFAYARARASNRVKVTLPSPLSLGQDWPAEDAAEAIRAEAARLAALGCTYIQIGSAGLRPAEPALTEDLDLLNRAADVPGVTFGVHLDQGGVRAVEAVFARLANFDVFLLGWDQQGAGSFEALAKVPDDKQIILGLVSSATTTMESPEELTARIDQAARYTGLERLGISTQDGFSPRPGADPIGEDVQEAKLELVAAVAAAVW